MFVHKIVIKIFVLLLAIMTFAYPSFANEIQIQSFKKVDPKLVCMVNDKFMGIDQIPVEVDGKIYYGCCNNCIAKLKENQKNVRYAIDPFSGEKIDKATAYTVALGDKTHKVLYFKSEVNYQNYLKKIGLEK